MKSDQSKVAKSLNQDLKTLSKGSPIKAQEQPEVGSVDYVAATLNAWNQCPTIVKKQLDEQYQQIKQLKDELRQVTLKLNQRKAEFERHAAVEMKVELIKHKDQIDSMYRQKLEDEKQKLTKKKVEEMDLIL